MRKLTLKDLDNSPKGPWYVGPALAANAAITVAKTGDTIVTIYGLPEEVAHIVVESPDEAAAILWLE